MTDLAIPVHVVEFTETLATTISQDLDEGWMLLPADMVARFEAAESAFRAVEAEVSAYIEANGLELNEEDEPPNEEELAR